MKKIYRIIGIILIFVLLFFAGNTIGDKRPTVTINNHAFYLYVVRTPKDREIGLSKYNDIPQNFGMIFLFDKPDFYSFWMKGMKFPIDIIFIKDYRVVTVYKNVSPPKGQNEGLLRYEPKSRADRVLEINSGLSQRYNIKENDIIKISNL